MKKHLISQKDILGLNGLFFENISNNYLSKIELDSVKIPN